MVQNKNINGADIINNCEIYNFWFIKNAQPQIVGRDEGETEDIML